MNTANPEEIKKETRKYFFIFLIILSLSLLTVGISYLRLSLPVAIFFALAITGIQVFFAAGYFMHLITEKRAILYIILALTVIFLSGVLFLPVFESHNTITGTVHHVH